MSEADIPGRSDEVTKQQGESVLQNEHFVSAMLHCCHFSDIRC